MGPTDSDQLVKLHRTGWQVASWQVFPIKMGWRHQLGLDSIKGDQTVILDLQLRLAIGHRFALEGNTT